MAQITMTTRKSPLGVRLDMAKSKPKRCQPRSRQPRHSKRWAPTLAPSAHLNFKSFGLEGGRSQLAENRMSEFRWVNQ